MSLADHHHSVDHDEDVGLDSDDCEVIAGPVLVPGPDGNASARGTTIDLTGEPISHNGDSSPLNVPLFIPRAYQLEMFEESLKRNIIVAVSHSCQVIR
jgi:hypothetical protein